MVLPTFCDSYKAWLGTDRKQPPPCATCADADSLVQRAVAVEKHAEDMRERAKKIVLSKHPENR